MRIPVNQVFPLETAMTSLRPRSKVVLGAALLFAAAAVVSPVYFVQITFILVAAVLVIASLVVFLGPMVMKWLLGMRLSQHARRLACDPLPSILCLRDGTVMHANPAAQKVFGPLEGGTIGDIVTSDTIEDRDALAALTRSALTRQDAQQEIAGKVITAIALDRVWVMWRAQHDWDVLEKGGDAIATITLDDQDTVLRTNAAARALLGANAEIPALFCPNLPLKLGQSNDIRTSDGMCRCFVFDLGRNGPGHRIGLVPEQDSIHDLGGAWSLLEKLPVPLLRLTADGIIELSNHPARELLGVSSGAGRRLSDLMEGPGRPMADWLRDGVEGRVLRQPETLQMRRKDKEVFVQVSLNPVREKGKTILIAVIQDATKLKSLEMQFVQSQKMQAIGQLAGGVAHDFNNLLTAISGHCDLLLLRHGIDDPTHPDLMQISQNANRAAALVGQLLAFSRKQMLRPEVMDLRDMLADVTHLLNRLVGATVSLSLRHDPNLWAVRADKRQLEQVLMNLVVNARDAMPEGGKVRIITQNLWLKNPLARDRVVMPSGRYVVVSVEDDGVGIPKDKIEKVFEPFYTSKKQGEGTGLGLSTAYGIVKQTGGFIFVDSTPGQGAAFTLYFPAHDAVATEKATKPKEVARIGQPNGVVMLVEDEAPVRAFAGRALRMRGFSVVEAASGEEALELMRDSSLAVDVVVTDVVMPGLDGPSWVRHARQFREGIRVVFVSGYAADSVSNTPDGDDASVFLPKPFSLTELVETVEAQISA